jgi:DNA-binding response OmpR family regulator
MRVLLVQFHPGALDALAGSLRHEGLVVLPVGGPEQALRRLASDHPQVVAIDTRPEGGHESYAGDALALVRALRETAQTPILLLGDQRDDSFVIQAYKEGIDAFVPAPCSPTVLAARLKALSRPRRAVPETAVPILHAEEFVLDPSGCEVVKRPIDRTIRKAEVLPLTRTEFRLFYLLAANAGRVVSTARLAEYAAEARARRGAVRVRQSMARLRQKLGLPHRGAKAIVAHPGVGYQYTGAIVGAPDGPSIGASVGASTGTTAA